jgi:hypothetical protein
LTANKEYLAKAEAKIAEAEGKEEGGEEEVEREGGREGRSFSRHCVCHNGDACHAPKYLGMLLPLAVF